MSRSYDRVQYSHVSTVLVLKSCISKNIKRGCVPGSYAHRVLPWQPDQKAWAEQEGGPALMHPPTSLFPNHYFLEGLTCVPFFLSSFPTPFSACALPIVWALLFGSSSSSWSPDLAAHIISPHSSHWGVTGGGHSCDFPLVQHWKCREGEVSGRMKSMRLLSVPVSWKDPPLSMVQ